MVVCSTQLHPTEWHLKALLAVALTGYGLALASRLTQTTWFTHLPHSEQHLTPPLLHQLRSDPSSSQV
jgi:hypothetical protein